MKVLCQKARIVQNLVEKYDLKHGDDISLEELNNIAKKESIEIKDLMIILGVKGSRIYEKSHELLRLRIKIYETEELENMGKDIFKAIQKCKIVGQEPLKYVSKEFRVNEWILNDILKKYINTNILLESGKRKVKNKIVNEAKLLEEVKYRDFVTKELVENWKKQYKMVDEEICSVLKCNVVSFHNLMIAKTKKMRIDLISKEEKKQIQEAIIQKCKTQDYINKNGIEELKRNIKTTDSILKDTLSLSNVMFEQIMKDETKKARIILKTIKQRVINFKMDIKYEYGERFYTYEELRKILKDYKLTIRDYFKNVSRNVKFSSILMQALKKNEKGIYIGKEHPISHEFAEKNAEKIMRLAIIMVKKYIYIPNKKEDFEDMVQDVNLLILEKGGCIEKNFGYDENLMFSLFASKMRYYIFAKRYIEYRETLWEHLEIFSEQEAIYESWNDNNKTHIVQAMDKRILIIHQKVMQFIYNNGDYIFQNKEKAYQLIAYKLKIPLEYLEKILEEIKIIYLEYNMAKICKDGSVINMADACYF